LRCSYNAHMLTFIIAGMSIEPCSTMFMLANPFD
jgi:hypothetical protein